MFKNSKLLGILLSVIIVLAFSISAYAFDYKYTQESGTGFFVGTADKADALEDSNELRQIINDLGALLVHSKMDGLYPKDLTTGGTIQIPEAGLKFSNAPVNNDIAAYIAGEMTWQTKAELNLVVTVGTPADSQIVVWTGDGTIEGAASLTYDGSNLQLTGDIGSTGTKITKGWFTDMTVANAIAGDITGNAATVTSFTPASGSLTLAGADALTLTTTAATNVTLPTTGTLLANVLEDTTPEYGGTMDHNNERDTEVKTIEFNGLYDNGNSGATPTINWQNGNYQKIAVSENTLFTFSNAFIGTITLQITFSGAFTVGFNAGYTILEEGGTEVTFTNTNGAVDMLKVMYLGTANNYVVGLMADVKD